MDKYEYNMKLEQIKKLIRKKDYATAAQIADTIDWYKVKNNQTIVLIADVYEASGRYEQAKENLKLAYDRSGLGRQIAYKLVKICIKCGDLEEAEDFYDDFVSAAPRDISKYILQYELAKAKGEPLDKQITILEQYLEEDMDDRWAFELAKLYHKSGQRDKCIEQCDTVMLWFSDGKYVEKAMDLKMIYTPLTKAQQNRYEARWREKSAENHIKIEEIKVKEVDVANKYNTQNIQNALKESMDELFRKERQEKDEEDSIFKPMQNQSAKKASKPTPTYDETEESATDPDDYIFRMAQRAEQYEDKDELPKKKNGGKKTRTPEEAAKREIYQMEDLMDEVFPKETSEEMGDTKVFRTTRTIRNMGDTKVFSPRRINRELQRSVREEIKQEFDEHAAEEPQAAYIVEEKTIRTSDVSGAANEEEKPKQGKSADEYFAESGLDSGEEGIGLSAVDAAVAAIEAAEAALASHVNEGVYAEETGNDSEAEQEEDFDKEEELISEETVEEPIEQEFIAEEPTEEELIEEEPEPEELIAEEPEAEELIAEEPEVEELIAEESEAEELIAEEPEAEELIAEEPKAEELIDEEPEPEELEEPAENLLTEKVGKKEENVRITGQMSLDDFLNDQGMYFVSETDEEPESEESGLSAGEPAEKSKIEDFEEKIEELSETEYIDGELSEEELDHQEENSGDESLFDEELEQPEDGDTFQEKLRESESESEEEEIEETVDEPEEEVLSGGAELNESDEELDGENFFEGEELDEPIDELEDEDLFGEEELEETEELEDEAFFGEEGLDSEEFFGEEELDEAEEEPEEEDLFDLEGLEEAEEEPEDEEEEEDLFDLEGLEEAEEEPEDEGEEEDLFDLEGLEEAEEEPEDEGEEEDLFDLEGLEEAEEEPEDEGEDLFDLEGLEEAEEEPEDEPDEEPEEEDLFGDEKLDEDEEETLEESEPEEDEESFQEKPEPLDPFETIPNLNIGRDLVDDDEEEKDRAERVLSNDEIKEIIKDFIGKYSGVQGLDKQMLKTLQNVIVDDNCNIFIMGDAKSGKTSLGIDIIKVVNKIKRNNNRRIAKISADKLNGKDMAMYFEKLEGSDLFIEHITAMDADVVKELVRAIRNDEDNRIVVIEDEKVNADRFIERNPAIQKIFVNIINVKQNKIRDWVTVAENYAAENGYSIDEMGSLALHAKIDQLYAITLVIQRNHVEGIVDNAIRKAEKGGLFKKLFGKRKEKVLSEEHFN